MALGRHFRPKGRFCSHPNWRVHARPMSIPWRLKVIQWAYSAFRGYLNTSASISQHHHLSPMNLSPSIDKHRKQTHRKGIKVQEHLFLILCSDLIFFFFSFSLHVIHAVFLLPVGTNHQPPSPTILPQNHHTVLNANINHTTTLQILPLLLLLRGVHHSRFPEGVSVRSHRPIMRYPRLSAACGHDLNALSGSGGYLLLEHLT